MKKLLKNKILLCGILITVYLCGLFFGVFMTVGYSLFQRQKPSLFRHAHRLEQEYLTGADDYFSALSSPTIRIFFFDAEGKLQKQNSQDTNFSTSGMNTLLQKELTSALAGKKSFRVTHAKEDTFRLTHFWLVTSIPIQSGDTIVGAVVLIRQLEYLQGATIGFLIYFTLLYWVCAVFWIFTLRKQQKLDELRLHCLDNITHAFKSPIASVKALAETLCDNKQPDPDLQKAYYGMILRENNKLEHLARDALELSKLQNHNTKFPKTAVTAGAIFDRLLEKYGTLCECADISLHIAQDIWQLPLLYTNEGCILQVVEFLMDNALKFVNEGGDIWLTAAVSKNRVTFCVQDNGVGISKEDLPHIFERFYKSNSKINETGNGLGLAIAKEIMNSLKEKIWAESAQGKGSSFFFTVHTTTN